MYSSRPLLVLAAVLLLATSARAEDPQPARVQVMVTVGHLTESNSGALQGSGIDRAQRVLESKNLQLALEQVGVMRLPTGDWVRIRPIKLEKGGLLMAVEVEPMVNTRIVLQRGRKVMIAAPRYQDGRLVISVRPQY